MTIHKFIFSGEIRYRIFRHSVFWIAYCIFFYVQSIVPTDYSGSFSAFTFYVAIESVIHFVPACIISVYVSLYYILPKLIVQRKVVWSVVAILALFAACTLINIFTSYRFNKLTPPNLQTPIDFDIVVGLAYLNAAWAFTAGGIAIGIRVIKSWIIQQKELLEVQRNKSRTEIELLKGRVLPDFLLSAVDTIKSKVDDDQQGSAHMVIILSDILSYILYDTSDDSVECNKEVFILQQYIALENLSQSNKIVLEVDSRSVFNTRYIPPLSLLSSVQNCVFVFSRVGLTPAQWKIRITSDERLRFRISCNFRNAHELSSGSEYLDDKLPEIGEIILFGNPVDVRTRITRSYAVVSGAVPFSKKSTADYRSAGARLDSQLAAYV